MPREGDSKTSSDSQRTLPGLLAKCGLAFPTFFVRDRHGSPEDPNRPVMTVADSPKKRKRALSPLPDKRIPIHPSESKAVEMTTEQMSEKEKAMKAWKYDSTKAFENVTKDVKDMDYIGEYERDHEQLLKREDDDAWDREAREGTDSMEKEAARIIRTIREFERGNTFGNTASEAIPGPHTRDMGGQFLTNKERIDNNSVLYDISKMVPKGSLLHLHFNAELHPELLLVRAREMENIYIRSTRPLKTQEDLDLTEMVFNVLDPETQDPEINIFSDKYPKPAEAILFRTKEVKDRIWMSWSKFQKEFEDRFGDKYRQEEPEVFREGRPAPTSCGDQKKIKLEPAENWLRSKMVLSQEEAYGFTQTVNGVWARFNQATRCFKGLLGYESVYTWYIGKAIDRMIEEKVMYAELRPMLLDKGIPRDSGKDGHVLSLADQMRLIIKGVKEKQAQLKTRGEEHKFPFGLKVIYCTPRSISNTLMKIEMKDCIQLKLQFPDLICGFDLVGAEDRPNHIGHYKEELLAFQEACKQLDIEIPFMFHAGETLLDTGGSGDPKNSNLYDAVLLKSKRIGHGFALLKHPHLVEQFRKTEKSPGICIELCPISNELLHLCRNVKEHPYPELLAAGIPCTVNSDNPSLFSNSMSHEFYQIMVGAPTMSLYSWKQLARWSIDYSCLTTKEQAEGHKHLNQSWKEFCKVVVDTYGHLIRVNEHGQDEVDPDAARASWPKMMPTVAK